MGPVLLPPPPLRPRRSLLRRPGRASIPVIPAPRPLVRAAPAPRRPRPHPVRTGTRPRRGATPRAQVRERGRARAGLRGPDRFRGPTASSRLPPVPERSQSRIHPSVQPTRACELCLSTGRGMGPAVIQGPAEGRVRDRRSTATGGTMPATRGSPTRFRRPEAQVGRPASRRTAGGLGTVQLGTTRRRGGRLRRPGSSRHLSGSRRSPRDPRPRRRPGPHPPPISSPPDAVLRPLLTTILRRPRIASPRRPAPRPLPTVTAQRLVLGRPPIPGPPETGPRLLRIGSRVPGTRPDMNERRLPRIELRIRAAPDRGRCLLVGTPGWSDPRLLGRRAGSVPARRVGSSASDGRRRGRRPVQLRRRPVQLRRHPRTGLPGTSRPLPGGRMLRWTTRATRVLAPPGGWLAWQGRTWRRSGQPIRRHRTGRRGCRATSHARWNRDLRSFLSDLKQAPVDRLVLREPTPEPGGRGARWGMPAEPGGRTAPPRSSPEPHGRAGRRRLRVGRLRAPAGGRTRRWSPLPAGRRAGRPSPPRLRVVGPAKNRRLARVVGPSAATGT